MSTPVLWPCEVSGAEKLTVGSKFHIKCSGTMAVPFKGPLHLEFPEKTDAHLLHLIQTLKAEPNALELVVTSYLAGEHKLKFVRITDGESAVESGEIQFQVASVLTQDSKPFPPLAPGALPFPETLLVTGGLILAVVVGGLAAFVLRRHRQKQLERDLEENQSDLAAKAQLEKTLRQLRRSLDWSNQISAQEASEKIKNLNQAVRVFLMRHFQDHMLRENPKIILKKIRPHVSENDFRQWSALLKELNNSGTLNSKMNKVDLIQLIDSAQKLGGRL